MRAGKAESRKRRRRKAVGWPGAGKREMLVAPFGHSGDTLNQRNLFLAVRNLEISLVTGSGTPSNWKRRWFKCESITVTLQSFHGE